VLEVIDPQIEGQEQMEEESEESGSATVEDDIDFEMDDDEIALGFETLLREATIGIGTFEQPIVPEPVSEPFASVKEECESQTSDVTSECEEEDVSQNGLQKGESMEDVPALLARFGTIAASRPGLTLKSKINSIRGAMRLGMKGVVSNMQQHGPLEKGLPPEKGPSPEEAARLAEAAARAKRQAALDREHQQWLLEAAAEDNEALSSQAPLPGSTDFLPCASTLGKQALSAEAVRRHLPLAAVKGGNSSVEAILAKREKHALMIEEACIVEEEGLPPSPPLPRFVCSDWAITAATAVPEPPGPPPHLLMAPARAFGERVVSPQRSDAFDGAPGKLAVGGSPSPELEISRPRQRATFSRVGFSWQDGTSTRGGKTASSVAICAMTEPSTAVANMVWRTKLVTIDDRRPASSLGQMVQWHGPLSRHLRRKPTTVVTSVLPDTS